MNDTERVEKYTKKVFAVIEEYITTPKHIKAFEQFFEKYGDRYFSCPASSKLEYHEAWVGGLAEHSLNVTSYLLKLVNLLASNKYTKEQIVMVGMMHDVGKIGDSKNDYYIPETSEWHRNKLGKMYTINKKSMGGHHSRNSLFILQDCGFVLTEEEFQAILYHDGQGLEINKDIRMKETSLVILTSFADRWSIQYVIESAGK